MSIGLLKSTKARDQILGWIRQGKVSPGERLPSERELAVALSVDHRTVRRGLEDLVRAGVIVKRPRVGNFLKESSPSELVTQIALVLPDWMLSSTQTHPLITLIFQGINRVLSHDRFAVSTFWYHQERLWTDAGKTIVDRGFHGAMIIPTPFPTVAEDIRKILASGVKVVGLDHLSPFQPDAEWFSVSFENACSMAFRQLMCGLIERGHRRIAAAMYKPSMQYEQGLQLKEELGEKYNLDMSRVLHAIPSDGYQADHTVLAKILDSEDRPTAIIVPDECVAAAVYRLCYERSISIPNELSIASIVDNTPHAHPIPLTAPKSAVARVEASEQAAGQLVKLLEGEVPNVRKIDYGGDIIWRASVKTINTGSAGEPKVSEMIQKTRLE